MLKIKAVTLIWVFVNSLTVFGAAIKGKNWNSKRSRPFRKWFFIFYIWFV